MPAAPLVEVKLPRGEIDVRDNRGNFRIASGFDVLPGQDVISGLVELAGIFDLDRRSLDALIETKELSVGGIRLPELRFFVAQEAGNFSVDSSTFNQAVSIDGRYRSDASGKFTLDLDEKLAFFDNFAVFVQNIVFGFIGDFFAKFVTLPKFFTHHFDDVVSMAVVFGKNQGFRHFLAVGEHYG